MNWTDRQSVDFQLQSVAEWKVTDDDECVRAWHLTQSRHTSLASLSRPASTAITTPSLSEGNIYIAMQRTN